MSGPNSSKTMLLERRIAQKRVVAPAQQKVNLLSDFKQHKQEYESMETIYLNVSLSLTIIRLKTKLYNAMCFQPPAVVKHTKMGEKY